MIFTSPTYHLMFFIILLLMTNFVVAAKGEKKPSKHDDKLGDDHDHKLSDGDEEESVNIARIVQDLVSGQRVILLACHLSNRILILVSGPNGKGDFDNGLVFDQVDGTLADSSLTLRQPKTVRNKWPEMVGKVNGPMFIAADFMNKYIILPGTDKMQAFSLEDRTFQDTLLVGGSQLYIQKQKISSGEALMVYTFDFGHPGYVLKYKFSSDTLPQSKLLLNTEFGFYLCTIGDDHRMIVAQPKACPESATVSWTIEAGYVDDQKFFFFDDDNAANYFPITAFSVPGSPVPLSTVQAKDFWKYTVQAHHTKRKSSATTPKTGKGTFMVILIVITLTVILSAIIITFCFCISKSSVLPGESINMKEIGKMESQGKLIWSNSMIISGKGSAVKSGNNSLDGAEAHTPTKVIKVPTITKVVVPPSPTSRKRTTSKGTLSKKRRSSSKRVVSRKRSKRSSHKRRISRGSSRRRASSRKVSPSAEVVLKRKNNLEEMTTDEIIHLPA